MLLSQWYIHQGITVIYIKKILKSYTLFPYMKTSFIKPELSWKKLFCVNLNDTLFSKLFCIYETSNKINYKNYT